MTNHGIERWIKTDCGRAKYADLAMRPGPTAKLRLWWFVLIAAIRDWRCRYRKTCGGSLAGEKEAGIAGCSAA